MEQNQEPKNKTLHIQSTEPRIFNGERQSLKKMGLGKLDIHPQKTELDICLIPFTKINLKWIKT